MKKNKAKKSIIILFILFFLCIQFCTHFIFVKPSYTSSEDVYDVILFWGQSNMVGSCGNRDYEKSADYRYTNTNSASVKAYSKKSGIDETFLSNSVRMNYVKITQTPNTVYEYNYLQNSLNEITENTEYFGEKLVYNSGKLISPTDSNYSIQKSSGTNIIPQFAKTYYEKTGHKVIVVFAANGGEKISHFLPSTDSEYDDSKNQKIYEAMVEKYKAAIKYLNDNNYTIGRRVWVSFQGETDVIANTSLATYKSQFLKVHNYLKNDLNITKGAIIQTSYDVYRASDTINSGVKNIRDAQVQLTNENDEIVLGSKYAYSHYIPHEESYNNSSYTNSLYLDENGNKLPFDEAFSIATSGVCDDGSSHDNSIHFTSAALCQIGKETAELLYKKLDVTPPKITISYSTTNPTNNDVIVTLKADEDIILTTNMEDNGWLRVDSTTVRKTYSKNVTNATITIYDLSGNGTEVTINISNIDKTSPTCEVSYSNTNPTNQDVVVTLAFNEDINYTANMQNSGWIKIDGKTYKKTYSENVSNAKRTIYDLAGNSTEVTINISNIDKTSPTCEVSYSNTNPTNEDVIVTLTFNEDINYTSNMQNNGWIKVNSKTYKKAYTDNISNAKSTFYDLAGNSTEVTLNISNIDKTPPTYEISYSNKKLTNQDVVVTLTFNKDINYTSNMQNSGWLKVDSKTYKKTYTENASNEKITVYDLVGNNTEVTVNINNIDKTPPTFHISYSTGLPTNQDVIVTLIFNEPIQFTSNLESSGWTKLNDLTIRKAYSENVSNANIAIYDLAGNSTEVTININNIDKVAPEAEVSYSTTEETYDSVTVTIHSNEELKDLNGWTRIDQTTFQKEYFQNTNGKITITIEDLVGNKTQKEIEITNIKNPFSIESQKYVIDNMIITMVYPNTSVTDFYNNITTSTNNKKIVDNNSKELSEQDLVTTNCTLLLDDKYSYIIIVKGDLNEDGKVTISDLALIQRKIFKPDTPVSETSFIAGDLDNNKAIAIKDLAAIQKYILTKSF